MLSTAVLIAASVVVGQAEGAPNSEHLQAFDALIGTWVYKGPVQEDVPNLPGKNTPMVVRSTFKRVFNKAVVENRFLLRFKGFPPVEGVNLYGWNAAEKTIQSGGMNSIGGMFLGKASFSDDGRVLSVASQGVDAEGREVSSTVVFKLQGEDTFVWQSINRQGQDLPPDSPKYTFKRVERSGDHDRHEHDDDEDDDEDDDDEDDDEDDDD
jgi:hypothetical protein